MPDVHAKLSASGAKRWMSCPPSAELESQLPDQTSEYAQEGTFAHSLAELILRYNNHEMTKKTFTGRLNKLKKEPYYNQEMQDYIDDYVQLVWDQVNEVKASCPDVQALFEQHLDFSEYVPEGFGTGDVVIIADDLVHVIDLKYGKGVVVSAEGNPQLRLYGIGACLEHSLLYDIKRIRMTIIQPRLDNLSTEELTVEELLGWAEEEVKPKALLAMDGKGEFCVGGHCRFCKAFATCRAQKDYQMELLKYDFAESALLENLEIADVLTRLDPLLKWAEAIKEHALNQALSHGEHFDGFKLVEGRSNRKYANETHAAEVLTNAGYRARDIYKEPALIGITDMTKLVGRKRFEELLTDVIIKPEGKPVLVPESDKRPKLNTAEKAREEFSDDDYHCEKKMRIYRDDHGGDLGNLAFWKARLKDEYDTETIETNFNTLKGE